MLDASIAFLWPDGMQQHTYLGPGATAPAPLHGILRAFPTADGFVTLLTISDAEFQGLTRALGRPELSGDPRFSSVATRMENIEALADIVALEMRKGTSEAICARLAAEGVPAAPIRMQDSVHEDPQVVANGLLLEIEHAQCGLVRIPGPVARFASTPSEVRRLAPVLGEHTDEVLTEMGVSPVELAELRAQSALA